MRNKFIKIVNKESPKYIQVLGVKIPYSVIADKEKRTAKIAGFLTLTYYRDEVDGSIYIKCLGKNIILRECNKAKRYKMREKLDVETKKKIILNTLTKNIGYKFNLDNPQTFNEKIYWLKLYNEDSRITRCCDKYAVKDYITERIGPGYIVPTIATWDDPEQIDFDKLPDKFVLKVNWSSGYNIIVKDKQLIDQKAVKEKLKKWMRPYNNCYYSIFNWGYKDMKPVCYAEEYIEQIDGQVYDYKFYFSKGEFIYMFIATDRHGDKTLTYTFFDDKFEPLPFTYGNKPNANPIPDMPKNLNKMIELGKILADDFPFVRVDFYEIGEEIYIGEMTFYSGGGMLAINPVEWDKKLGDKIKI